MSLGLNKNELLELATKDIDGVNLIDYVQNKHKDWHPTKVVNFLAELFKDKEYCKLVANLLTVKFQRIRSNTLKAVDTLMTDGDADILKQVDKLLQLVVKFSQLDDDEKSENRLIIRMPDGTEEKFRQEQQVQK